MRRRITTMARRALSIRFPPPRWREFVSEQWQEMAASAALALTAFTLLSSLVLGGGTRSGFLSDAILQLLSIPLLLFAVSRLAAILWGDPAKWRQVRWELAFCLVAALLPLVQLLPLPPWLWTLLPNRAPSIAAYEDIGHRLPWMPISVSPYATSLTVPALLPPLAIFFGTMLLNYRERRLLSFVVVAFGIVSAFLGLLQIAQGPASSLRFFAFTNLSEAVGFFANRNHFAALLYVVLLFAAVWAMDIGFTAGLWRYRKTFEARSIVAVTASFLAIVVLLAAEAMARSRAGMILTMVGLVGVYALILSDRRRGSGATPVGFFVVAAGTAIIFALQFGLYRVLERFRGDPLDDSRLQFAKNTLQAAKAYLPFGSGLGTFVPVYAMFEKPEDLFAHSYINHAHDDVVEFCLEAGIIGAALMAAFVAWLVSRSMKIWLRGAVGVGAFDHALARASTIAVVLLVAHSFADYPLRTAAMMGLFAFACGLLLEPLTADPAIAGRQPQNAPEAISGDMVRRSSAAPAAATWPPVPANPQQSVVAANPPRRAAARWGEGVDWPDAWRKGAKPGDGAMKRPKPASGEEPREP